ncbi:MAG: ATPase, partial [Gammaproteobacteria bacterium]|nr:ATPase [Gammaproteobacteria bacterium]
GLYSAHAQGQELNGQHLLDEIHQTKPLSVVMAEKIAGLRAWAADRTVPSD